MLQTQKKEFVENEMKELTAEYQSDKLEFIKNPVVAEFLGLASNTDFTESDLEKSILTNLQKFLMELGKGYAFCKTTIHPYRKKGIFIDLVFTCRRRIAGEIETQKAIFLLQKQENDIVK